MRLDGGSEAEARERTVGHILNIQVIFAILSSCHLVHDLLSVNAFFAP